MTAEDEEFIRGVYMTRCDFCSHSRACRLVQHEDRYLWKCLGHCLWGVE